MERNAIAPTRARYIRVPAGRQGRRPRRDIAVRGCMVIKPWGYDLGEYAVGADRRFKEQATPPTSRSLYRSDSWRKSRARRRLREKCRGDPSPIEGRRWFGARGSLEEPLVVRPTSETIGAMFMKWIQPIVTFHSRSPTGQRGPLGAGHACF